MDKSSFPYKRERYNPSGKKGGIVFQGCAAKTGDCFIRQLPDSTDYWTERCFAPTSVFGFRLVDLWTCGLEDYFQDKPSCALRRTTKYENKLQVSSCETRVKICCRVRGLCSTRFLPTTDDWQLTTIFKVKFRFGGGGNLEENRQFVEDITGCPAGEYNHKIEVAGILRLSGWYHFHF